ncbi:D-sedoheptulose-7-phosphate isomerase [Prevotella intermedia]|uniref:Phosphoheptose isomerase n=1 Tax=Prevotella intermedia TaxID=28131 RepID=A0A2G8ICI6_PREIN|nr:SIS domain-containing protein [Prevotella intermedia]PIK21225.1 phosphoheptose isomerase [Prevotella intermedia]
MSEKQYKYINSLLGSYPKLNVCKNDIIQAYEILRKCYSQHHKLLICGNGGSAADSEHIVGELMKGFTLPRKVPAEMSKKFTQVDNDLGNVLAENLQGALPSIALTTHTALSTAFMNDCQPVLVFAQQVYGYAQKGDCFLGISTSGNSQNVLYAAVVAKAQGLSLIGLTGAKQNKLERYCDVCIHVPETETYKIQELHLPIYHCICLMLEDYFFGD